MTAPTTSPPRSGAARGGGAARLGTAERIALGLSLLWLATAGLVFAVLPGDPGGGGAATTLMTLLAVILPIALFWIAAAAATAARRLQDENRRLEARLEEALQGSGGSAAPAAFSAKLDEIARVQKKTEAAVAHLTSLNARTAQPIRPMDGPAPNRAVAPPVDLEQPTLALVHPAPSTADRLSVEDFISALDFPVDASDKAGFRALGRALRDPQAKGLVRSSEDVLTLLAEDGIYMDDLTPDRVHPDVWRRFARGERGPAIAGLGGIRDRNAVARTAGRLRKDPVFRDCAHHFLRRFDRMLASFEPDASDAEIAALSETRTARAFMLIGRTFGTFD